MKERLVTLVLGALALGTGCSNGGPAWTYSGAEGPPSWGTLDPTFAACGSSGRSQSPVYIVEVLPRDLPNLVFKYGTAPVRLRNTGRAIEQTFDPGQSVAIGNVRYELQSLTLHNPSEHRAAGKVFPMEVQLLHKSAQGHLLVVSIMVKNGVTAAALGGILNHLPPTAGDTYDSDRPLPLVQLLPTQRTYMRYSGSLTTPPCWENVMWVVLTEPISASKAHLQALAAILPNNVRPLAPLGRRTVFLDATP